MAQLYEYAVILQEKEDADGNVLEKAQVVVEPTTVLANDNNQAALIAGRAIPEDYMDRIDRLSVAVRPF